MREIDGKMMVTGCWKKMDDPAVSSRSCSPLGLATTPSSFNKPRTYTTAGTIYNPSSAQPLQAPTRRGRVPFRWPICENDNGTLRLLPRSALESLPLRGPGYARSVQQQTQYSPLQQNYDRAISPESSNLARHSDHFFANMSAIEDPLANPQLTYATIRDLVSSSDEDKPGEGDNASDEIDEASLAPLKNMTVASLKNLASYPNPQQDLAKKLLSRPVSGIAWCGRPTVPKSPPSTRPIGSPKIGDSYVLKPQTPSTVLRAPPGLPYLPPNNDLHSFNFKDGAADARLAAPPPTNGHGAPQPLTAGPPGQRQYRPSTFKPTFKAVQPLSDLGSSAINQKANMNGAECEEAHVVNMRELLPTFLSKDLVDKSYLSASTELNEQERCTLSRKDGLRPTGSITSSWNTRTELLDTYDPSADRWAEDAQLARNVGIDRYWYSGAGSLNFKPRQAIHEAKFRKMQHSIGIIGDRRPNSMQTNEKKEYPWMQVKEAVSIPTYEHARPLLNLAFASISRVQTDLKVESPWRIVPTPQAWSEQHYEHYARG